tara:strand:- start:4505 stop:7564 length:3060 start_codon:yes stop_codon:yes gene_type:complete
MLQGCEPVKTDVELLVEAKSKLANNESNAALIHLKNALQVNPNNLEARYLLGNIYLKQEEGAAATKEYDAAARLGTNPDTLADEYAQAFFYQNRFEDLLELQPAANNPEDESLVRFYQGLANLNLQRIEKAISSFELAASLSTDTRHGQLAKAWELALSNNIPEAKALALQIQLSNPDFSDAHILASRLYLTGQENFNEAAIQMQKAIDKAPNRYRLYYDIANIYYQNNQDQLARQNLDILLGKQPNHPGALLLKSRLALRERNWLLAKSLADKVLANLTTDPDAQLIAGISNFYLKNFETSLKYLLAVKHGLKPDHIGRRILAYLEIQEGTEGGEGLLRTLGWEEGQNLNLVTDLGIELAKLGRHEDAKLLFEKIVKSNPTDLDSLTRLGISKLQLDDPSGITDLHAILEQDATSITARSVLTSYYLRQKNYVEALKLSQSAIESQPDSALGYILKASTLSEQNKSSQALEILDAGLSYELMRQSQKTALLLTKASIFASIQAYEDSEFQLEKILDGSPTNKRALTALYQISKQTGGVQTAYEKISTIASLHPEDSSLTLLKAQILIDQERYQEASTTFKMIPPSALEHAKAIALQGFIALKQEDFQNALGHFKAWREVDRTNIQAHQAVVTTYNQLGQHQQALTAAQQLANTFLPNDDINQLLNQQRALLAREYLKDGQHEKAQQIEQTITADQATTPLVKLITGEIQLASKQFLKAKKTLLQLIERQPDSAPAHYLLARANEGLQDTSEYKKELQKTLELAPSHYPSAISLARLALAEDNPELAKKYLSILNKIAPKRSATLEIEARILVKSKQPEQALAIYQTLYTANPNTKTVQMMANQQWSMNNQQAATATLEAWSDRHNQDISTNLKLANFYLIMNQNTDAVRLYQRVLEHDSSNLLALNNLAWQLKKSAPDQAAIYAQKAFTMAPESTVVMDTLAMVILNQGEYKKAQQLIDRALKLEPKNPTLRYHRTLLLEKNGLNTQARQELGELLSNDATFPEIEEAKQLLKMLNES